MIALPIPITLQIEAIDFAEMRQRSMLQGNATRKKLGEHCDRIDMQALNAAARSLKKLQEDASAIHAFLKLPANAREAMFQGTGMIDKCWRKLRARDDRASTAEHPDSNLITRVELAALLAIAAVGGSVR